MEFNDSYLIYAGKRLAPFASGTEYVRFSKLKRNEKNRRKKSFLKNEMSDLGCQREVRGSELFPLHRSSAVQVRKN